MVVTKKSTKTVNKKSSNLQTKHGKTIGRGRPKKEFIPKHKRIAKETDKKMNGRSLAVHQIPRAHKIFRLPNKEKSILYLFIFSIVLFILSVGISQIKKQKIDTVNPETTQQAAEVTTQETIPIIEEEKQDVVITETDKYSQQLLTHFYQAINTKDFSAAAADVDTSLKNSTTFRTYFSTKRLTRFLDNLTEGMIYVSDIKETIHAENPDIADVNYILKYTLSTDNQTYTENRIITTIKKTEGYKIAAIKCETQGCSRMPFFNPGKYNIK